MTPERLADGVTLWVGDCRRSMPSMAADSFDAVVCDPPYELGFMGKGWDSTGVAFDPVVWAEVLRVTKPGGYMVAMGGSRTYHRLACAVEDAGWQIRDCLMWLYGTGFPKGHGCLKPAYEPIILARKPGPKVLPLGIDECRVPVAENDAIPQFGNGRRPAVTAFGNGLGCDGRTGEYSTKGRWPANVLHDGSPEVMEAFAAFGEKTSGKAGPDGHKRNQPNGFGTVGNKIYGNGKGLDFDAGPAGTLFGDTGTAARFFYCAKASGDERDENGHPTVKPLKLMRWLVRLVCPKDGQVLDTFAGSGSTLVAAIVEGMTVTGCELEHAHADIIRRRIKAADCRTPGTLFADDLFTTEVH